MSLLNWLRRQIGTDPDPLQAERTRRVEQIADRHSYSTRRLIETAERHGASIQIDRDWQREEDTRLR